MYALLDKERKKFISYVRSLMRETAEMDAEDIVQDVLLKMFEKQGSPLAIENMTAYVYRSLKNRVIDHSRTKKPLVSIDEESDKEGLSLLDVLEDRSPNALKFLMTEQGKQKLFKALETLKEIEREVLVRHEFDGDSFKDLALELDIPKNTLLSHKSRAMQKLKHHYVNKLGEE